MTTVVKLCPTFNRCQKVIKKLNKIIIARLTISNQPNILGDTKRFNTTTNWTIFTKEFETWLADSIFNATLFTLKMYITNQSYLKHASSHFMELLDDNTEKSNKFVSGLDSIATIPNNNIKQPLDLSNLKAKQTKKKENQTQKR